METMAKNECSFEEESCLSIDSGFEGLFRKYEFHSMHFLLVISDRVYKVSALTISIPVRRRDLFSSIKCSGSTPQGATERKLRLVTCLKRNAEFYILTVIYEELRKPE